MVKFDFTRDEYEDLKNKMMLNEELSEIFEMRIKGYSVTKMAMKLHMSESSINRRIKLITHKLQKVIK